MTQLCGPVLDFFASRQSFTTKARLAYAMRHNFLPIGEPLSPRKRRLSGRDDDSVNSPDGGRPEDDGAFGRDDDPMRQFHPRPPETLFGGCSKSMSARRSPPSRGGESASPPKVMPP